MLIGIALYIAMAALAQLELFRAGTLNLRNYGALGLIAGWWIGGRGVLAYFWAKLPRGGAYTAARD